jgi:plasmid stabilization system protein ParE
MSLPLWFHPDAETELNDAADYYAAQSPRLDRQFIAEIEQALSQIVAFPEAAAIARDRARCKVLLGYPYSLMYSVTESAIRVLAVAHHRRRPFYWRGRE